MTYQEEQLKFDNLLAACLGKPVEMVDSTNYAQCFDWAIRWCVELGFPSHIFSGLLYAYQIWSPSTPLAKTNFEFIPNTPTGIPRKGDIVIFNTKVGIAGHVSVATGKGDVNTFQSSDQNWAGKLYIQLVTHNYDAVVGWLRLKVSSAPVPIQSEMDKITQHDATLKTAQDVLNKFTFYNTEIGRKDTQIGQLQQSNNELMVLKDGLTKDTIKLKEDLAECQRVCQLQSDSKYKKVLQDISELCNKTLLL